MVYPSLKILLIDVYGNLATKPYPSMVPMLTEMNRLKRLDWAKKYKNNYWCHTILRMKPHFGSLEVSFVYGLNLEQ